MRTYGALDLLFAAFYAYVGFGLAPGRSVLFNGVLAAVVGLLAVSGVGLCAQTRWARPVGLLSAVVLLLFAGVVLGLLLASSAYLYGVYGSLGRGIAVVCLAVAALVVQLCALLPLFQLRYLWRRRG